MTNECRNCTYFEDEFYEERRGEGECRRNPPILVKSTDPNGHPYIGKWPVISNGEWCGEHIERTK
jgi:hypothetical protein